MTMLFDANKRLIKVNDIYPEDVQLAKGSYTIRAQLRHDNRGTHKTLNLLGCLHMQPSDPVCTATCPATNLAMPSDMEQQGRKIMTHSSTVAAWLEKLKGLVAVVERKLGDGIAVSAYPSYAAFLRSPKDVVKERSLYAGDGSKATTRTWQLKMLTSGGLSSFAGDARSQAPPHVLCLPECLLAASVGAAGSCPAEYSPCLRRRESGDVPGAGAGGQAAEGCRAWAPAHGGAGAGKEGQRQRRGAWQGAPALHVSLCLFWLFWPAPAGTIAHTRSRQGSPPPILVCHTQGRPPACPSTCCAAVQCAS